MRVWWWLLLGGCTFHVPSAPGARQSCIDWYTAWEEKALACGLDPMVVEAAYRDRLAMCAKVIWSDSADVHERCIPELRAASCESISAAEGGCGRFL